MIQRSINHLNVLQIMLRKMSLVLLIFSCVFISCNKEVEQVSVQEKKDTGLSCKTNVTVWRSATYPIDMSEDFQRKTLLTSIQVYRENYLGKGYIKRTVNTEDQTINVSIIKFGFGTPAHEAQSNADRTIWSGDDKFFAEYMYNINHYFADEPCEIEIVIFQIDGIWYVEDCC